MMKNTNAVEIESMAVKQNIANPLSPSLEKGFVQYLKEIGISKPYKIQENIVPFWMFIMSNGYVSQIVKAAKSAHTVIQNAVKDYQSHLYKEVCTEVKKIREAHRMLYSLNLLLNYWKKECRIDLHFEFAVNQFSTMPFVMYRLV